MLTNVDTNSDLEYIFKDEISIYKSLLLLETNKKDFILKSNGKELENSTTQINHLLMKAKEAEQRRIAAIDKLFEERNLTKKDGNVTLNELIGIMNETEKPVFQKLAEDLRNVVSSLRERVTINEKLLRAKQEIFQLSMEALKAASGTVSQEVSYEVPSPKINRSRTSVMLNAKA